jgi:hypothetical protein
MAPNLPYCARQGFGIFVVLAGVFLAWNGYVYAKNAA